MCSYCGQVADWGIVLPHNKLGGQTWSYLRDWLITRVRVVAVVGLDRNAFLPHTHQKTSVLFGVKRESLVREPESEPILFAISNSSGKDSSGRLSLVMVHRQCSLLGIEQTMTLKMLSKHSKSSKRPVVSSGVTNGGLIGR